MEAETVERWLSKNWLKICQKHNRIGVAVELNTSNDFIQAISFGAELLILLLNLKHYYYLYALIKSIITIFGSNITTLNEIQSLR